MFGSILTSTVVPHGHAVLAVPLPNCQLYQQLSGSSIATIFANVEGLAGFTKWIIVGVAVVLLFVAWHENARNKLLRTLFGIIAIALLVVVGIPIIAGMINTSCG